ncbi:MAG: quinoprotein dehydrogenase-associated putative ABC transporter substrate-binding protein [Acidobacteria bacterium]|nr:MAG: quinoprotein dehydrogenase-associated putative ABC transporter substrate-binding protein [Acidobacteriota bacterium]
MRRRGHEEFEPRRTRRTRRINLFFFVIFVSFVVIELRALDASSPEPLRVCADPNNLPFTNSKGEGFENKLAALLARDLGTRVEYTWFAQRRGFLRNTLSAQQCDVVMGLPSGSDAAWTTRPYYRSTYVFVTSRSRNLRIQSFDDPRLRSLRVGVELVGDDGANTPPAHALSRRGIVDNIVGYSVYGDYRTNSPPSAIIAAVARGEVDVAAAWGPMAGYFAARQPVALDVVPVQPQVDGRFLPQTFSIAMATRRRDTARHDRLEHFIDRRRGEIDRILADYHVPRVDE